MSGKLGRPTQSALGRKRRFDVLLTPEDAARLIAEYGSVQRAVRAFVASLDAPEAVADPAAHAPEQKSTTLCPRCLRIGIPSCAACRASHGCGP